MNLCHSKIPFLYHDPICIIDEETSQYLISTSCKKKQPCRDVLWKRCSEKIQQIYRRKHMSKSDFKKICYATFLESHFHMGLLKVDFKVMSL